MIMTPLRLLYLLVMNILCIAIGAVCFSYLEYDNDQKVIGESDVVARILRHLPRQNTCLHYDTVDEALRSAVAEGDWLSMATPNSSQASTKWSVLNSAYFCLTVVTTIGYGNMSPATSGGQLFFIFYAVVSIPLMLVFLAYVGFHINNLNRKLFERMDCFENPKLNNFVDTFVICALGAAFFVLMPAVVFCYIEGWSYTTACYFAVVTMSSVGFGDYAAGSKDNDLYRVMVTAWTVLGLAWFAGLINNIQSKLQKRMDHRLKRVEHRLKRFSKRKTIAEQDETTYSEVVVSEYETVATADPCSTKD